MIAAAVKFGRSDGEIGDRWPRKRLLCDSAIQRSNQFFDLVTQNREMRSGRGARCRESHTVDAITRKTEDNFRHPVQKECRP